MKYTFLSKWTVLILTVVTVALTVVGIGLIGGGLGSFSLPLTGIGGVLVILGGVLVYALAWIIALADSIQERAWGWSIGLVVLLPLGVGPLLYSFLGPKNTK
jgi:hypothetical protein